MASERGLNLFADDDIGGEVVQWETREATYHLEDYRGETLISSLPQVTRWDRPGASGSASSSSDSDPTNSESGLVDEVVVGEVAGSRIADLMARFTNLPPMDDDILPAADHPLNFGVIVPGVYRSSYPQARDYPFLKNLGLKTIVTLTQKDFSEEYRSFMDANGIAHHLFNMKGTKKEAIPIGVMKSILNVVLDRANHPLLIHCNHGKHRTGCVVAVVRKVSGWALPNIIDEYRTYAEPKVRECDIAYINNLKLADLSTTLAKRPSLSLRAHSFFRVSFFTFFVLLLWLVSTTKMATQRRRDAR